ncbi:MAG: ParB/RepB/Spo0J family partition protein [Planctomycetota bacterium]
MARKPTPATTAEQDSGSTAAKPRRGKSSRLGRGLQSLMSAPPSPSAVAVESSPTPAQPAAAIAPAASPEEPAATTPDANGESVFHVELNRVRPNRHQPRQRWDDGSLDGLAASIREQGVMQPIVVRPGVDAGEYELVAGERRWRAAQRAGLSAVPALLRELTDEQSAQWALVENVQREDLNAMDRAEAVQGLVDQFGLTHAEVAGRLGLQRATITNLTRLLGLAPTVRAMVRDGLLSMGHARALAGLADEKQQVALAERIVREGLSVRQVEAAVRAFHVEPDVEPTPSSPATPAHLTELERDIADRLGLRVKLKTGRAKGSGSLEIKFATLDEFDSLLGRLNVSMSAGVQ